jgi:hypothetical protein
MVHFLEIDRGANARQEHLVFKFRVDVREFLIDVARRGFVRLRELCAFR